MTSQILLSEVDFESKSNKLFILNMNMSPCTLRTILNDGALFQIKCQPQNNLSLNLFVGGINLCTDPGFLEFGKD